MIEMQPAAELSDEQNVDNWWWDPFDYKVLRWLNKAYIENKKTIEDILKMIDDNTLEQFLWLEKWYLDTVFATSEKQKEESKRIWRLKAISYFKRVQTPPVITITRSSFGFDRREAQNKPYSWEDNKDT
jgi:NAD+ synthase (glutamine-hydrolysing)